MDIIEEITGEGGGQGRLRSPAWRELTSIAMVVGPGCRTARQIRPSSCLCLFVLPMGT